jgi:hypothetical protein
MFSSKQHNAVAWLFLAAFCQRESLAFAPRTVETRPPFFRLQMATVPDYNSVDVAKTGVQGAVSTAQRAVDQNLSLGAPRARPTGGHFLTKGGVQVTANVEPLEFSKSLNAGTSESAIEHLIDQLDSHRGVLLTSSYEFPGRYARWSLGFVDPPLEVSGKADKCTIRALNERGKILLPAIEKAMQMLKEQEILSDVTVFQESASSNGEAPLAVQIDVTVVPPPEVGTFSEEERSRQVRGQDGCFLKIVCAILICLPLSCLCTIAFFVFRGEILGGFVWIPKWRWSTRTVRSLWIRLDICI